MYNPIGVLKGVIVKDGHHKWHDEVKKKCKQIGMDVADQPFTGRQDVRFRGLPKQGKEISFQSTLLNSRWKEYCDQEGFADLLTVDIPPNVFVDVR